MKPGSKAAAAILSRSPWMARLLLSARTIPRLLLSARTTPLAQYCHLDLLARESWSQQLLGALSHHHWGIPTCQHSTQNQGTISLPVPGCLHLKKLTRTLVCGLLCLGQSPAGYQQLLCLLWLCLSHHPSHGCQFFSLNFVDYFTLVHSSQDVVVVFFLNPELPQFPHHGLSSQLLNGCPQKEPGTVAHGCKFHTWEAETGRSWAQGSCA